jgi:hypothetical protein
MTKTELILFEKMISNAVEKAVNEALEVHIKKELKDLKVLTAKLIKENRELKGSPINENYNTERWITKTSSDASTFNKASARVAVKPMVSNFEELPKIPSTIADRMEQTGELPDVDAPIFFDKNSSVMQAFKDKFIN